jgi:hypothetical protein
MKIRISTPSFGKYFRYCIEFQGLLLWHSESFYHKLQDALNAAFLDVWCALIERNFSSPAGLFDLKSGVVLATNYAHKRGVGCDRFAQAQGAYRVGCHYNDVLRDFKVNSCIVPAGTRALGLYEFLGGNSTISLLAEEVTITVRDFSSSFNSRRLIPIQRKSRGSNN